MTQDKDRDHLKVQTPAWLDREARIRRDARLVDSDWMVIRALETKQPVPADWAAYRQALRDITKQPGYPTTIDWPQQPELES